MTAMLSAPNAVSATIQTPGRNNESRANEAAKADTEGGTPTPFAAVLKSTGKKDPANSSEANPSSAETQPDAEYAATPTVPIIDPSALLSVLEAASPLAAQASPTALFAPSALLSPQELESPLLAVHAAHSALAPAASSASHDETDTLSVTTSAPSPTPIAAPAILASAVSPAPTPPIREERATEKNVPQQGRGLSTDLAEERSTTPDKLAVETAIAAESGKSGSLSTSSDSGGEDFRAVMERMATNPATAVTQTTGTSAAAAPMPGLRVETPLAHTGWRDEVGQKLTWMVSNNRQQAELVLNPPQLGRIEVTLALDGDQASVSFASPHAAVRETLENSMTRLREVLAEAGVTLGQTHVSADSRHDSNSMHPNNNGLASGHRDEKGHAETIGTLGSGSASRSELGRGMVDVFA